VKVVTVVGARPQFVKAACVSRAILEAGGVEEVMVHTGQHFDSNMSDVFFDELAMPEPAHHLGVSGGHHGEMTARMLTGIERVILDERPDWVLVYGDTNSTLAGALAATKVHVPVAHLEAGLRSGNRGMPEEVNRVLTDHASDLLLPPTAAAVHNLRREGIPDSRVRLVGDVMLDAALFYGSRASLRSSVLQSLGVEPGSYVLATVHRAGNVDDHRRLQAILSALDDLTRDFTVLLPLHPRTRQAVSAAGLNDALRRVQVLEPVGYLDMVMLERSAAVIATDSGGVQKEAFFHGIPCVTLRDETEWTELVDLGWNRLAPPLEADIAATIRAAAGTRGEDAAPYGDGTAADQTISLLLHGTALSREATA
jgi:UDP-GlcNAc3NAcA epimerase